MGSVDMKRISAMRTQKGKAGQDKFRRLGLTYIYILWATVVQTVESSAMQRPGSFITESGKSLTENGNALQYCTWRIPWTKEA